MYEKKVSFSVFVVRFSDDRKRPEYRGGACAWLTMCRAFWA